ncbi:DUF4233 domain-containing protein [Brachybacterium sp. EF45031]|uniref:DUF4233 domain-containing protein n=1 Tax=Brachybacterium sillae TaxID=2810536 RepID=UPI00217E3124|nr:DUF4233 domain-containing protein [Brachybacterium sillae]MCS6712309.1 DUF4233 domain-containing protein [Brachybacterium sillae]
MPLIDLTPSGRAHGAQRMLSATTLTVEALVIVFATLAAHQLQPDTRTLAWTWGLALAAALLLCSGWMRRCSAAPYLVGLALQIPVIAFGTVVSAMWALGLLFAALYLYGLVKGNQWDREKDEVDRQVLSARAEADDAQNPRASR